MVRELTWEGMKGIGYKNGSHDMPEVFTALTVFINNIVIIVTQVCECLKQI